jgi:hypothetical protein
MGQGVLVHLRSAPCCSWLGENVWQLGKGVTPLPLCARGETGFTARPGFRWTRSPAQTNNTEFSLLFIMTSIGSGAGEGGRKRRTSQWADWGGERRESREPTGVTAVMLSSPKSCRRSHSPRPTPIQPLCIISDMQNLAQELVSRQRAHRGGWYNGPSRQAISGSFLIFPAQVAVAVVSVLRWGPGQLH